MSESFSSTFDNAMSAAIERAEKAEAENAELKALAQLQACEIRQLKLGDKRVRGVSGYGKEVGR